MKSCLLQFDIFNVEITNVKCLYFVKGKLLKYTFSLEFFSYRIEILTESQKIFTITGHESDDITYGVGTDYFPRKCSPLSNVTVQTISVQRKESKRYKNL